MSTSFLSERSLGYYLGHRRLLQFDQHLMRRASVHINTAVSATEASLVTAAVVRVCGPARQDGAGS